jgi:hypothetical protein
LDKLCSRVKTHENFKLDVSDLGEKGILRSTTYLLKVAQLDGIRTSPEWNEIRNIQSIRNLLVHADGKLGRNGDSGPTKIVDYIVKSEFLGGEAEIEIRHGYLAYCLGRFNVYFEKLDAALQRKYKS